MRFLAGGTAVARAGEVLPIGSAHGGDARARAGPNQRGRGHDDDQV